MRLSLARLLANPACSRPLSKIVQLARRCVHKYADVNTVSTYFTTYAVTNFFVGIARLFIWFAIINATVRINRDANSQKHSDLDLIVEL